jgi:hypothetical protein
MLTDRCTFPESASLETRIGDYAPFENLESAGELKEYCFSELSNGHSPTPTAPEKGFFPSLLDFICTGVETHAVFFVRP